MSTALRNAAIVGLAALVLILTLFVLRPAPAVETRVVAPPSVVQEQPNPAALWVGDSFTEGYGARNPRMNGYACPVSQAMGWTCNLDAQGGTGYINNGRRNVETYGPFKDRLQSVRRRYLADVIIVDGGRNDRIRPAADVATAARKYLTAVRELWPRAEIVVIAPYFLRDNDVAFSRELVTGLEPTLAEIDAHLIDPVAEGWIPAANAPQLLFDEVHPNDAGYRYIAKHLIADLRRLGLADVAVTDRRGPNFT